MTICLHLGYYDMFRLDFCVMFFFFFQAEDGIRDLVRSRGLGDVYKRQHQQVCEPIPRPRTQGRLTGRRWDQAWARGSGVWGGCSPYLSTERVLQSGVTAEI
eukprot:TRINITY_DN3029_c0_g1_i2.p1 TRINITY_DN3029_c0_g1~~TRINITY_DN3029_c0_g1_i2.p1  ORF type:complete len:102 (+),score=20.46 TRINITY_DN3029_c0_g1_i2:3-308(+)